MEEFYIRFHMNNGDVIDITIEKAKSFDLISDLNQHEKWYKHESTIVNLSNVNYVKVSTKTERDEAAEANVRALENFRF